MPAVDDCVELPAATYRLGEGAGVQEVRLGPVLIGRFPVANAQMAAYVDAAGRSVSPALSPRLTSPALADHPVTEVTFAEATAFCAWLARELGRPVRLPTGAEWEAAARGADGRPWPWGEVFDPERCASVEAGWGWTVPVTAHPAGAGPLGAEQMAGNVWEWVDEPAEGGAWRSVRGGCYLDAAWGVRGARALAADPTRATATTGFRVAIDPTPTAKERP